MHAEVVETPVGFQLQVSVNISFCSYLRANTDSSHSMHRGKSLPRTPIARLVSTFLKHTHKHILAWGLPHLFQPYFNLLSSSFIPLFDLEKLKNTDNYIKRSIRYPYNSHLKDTKIFILSVLDIFHVFEDTI